MKTRLLPLIYALLLYNTAFSAFQTENLQSIFDVMHYQEVLDLTLTANFAILKNNHRHADPETATLTFKDINGDFQKWGLNLELRGKYRRMNCEMPPLKLNFKKSTLAAAGLARFDDLKLVTQCVSNKIEAKELVLKEYLAYKLYNELSENSYRVQLVRVTYKDTQSGAKSKEWAFLIEDTAQLAARRNAKKVKGYGFKFHQFEATSMKKMALFQYMIGNTDWDLVKNKNIKMLEKRGQITPVPYDFDFSGFVNASYATPDLDYNLASLQERIFLLPPSLGMDMHATIQLFLSKKEVLIELVKKFKLLSRKNRIEIITYLNSYFEHAEDLRMLEVEV